MSGAGKPIVVPNAFEVRELFEGLLGRDSEWDSARAVDILDGASVATYADDRGSLVALALADIALTAWAGSAIGLLPQPIAQQAVADELVTPAQFDNMAEILNVAASLLNKPDSIHVRLTETYAPRETVPAAVADLALQQANRIDGEVAIQGYGVGRISIVVRI